MAIEGPSRFPCVSHSDPWLTCRDHTTEEFAIEIPDEDADRITTVGEGESPLLLLRRRNPYRPVADLRKLSLQRSTTSPSLRKPTKQ